MSNKLKIITTGAIFCILGAICLDFNLKITGTTLIILGCCAIFAEPLINTL
jgi:hypothetical protein